jgi:hypothetical protein
VFTPNLREQLPTDPETLVPKGHVVRVAHEAVEKMDLRPVQRQYQGGGTSSSHPKRMLKLLVYSASQRRHRGHERCGWKRGRTRASDTPGSRSASPWSRCGQEPVTTLCMSGARN